MISLETLLLWAVKFFFSGAHSRRWLMVGWVIRSFFTSSCFPCTILYWLISTQKKS